ncbi:MAG: calcium-binding protein [Methyloceanibacter sp.]|uniref:calcium-binding protein n=1 Tax=Methyloceanibacter sp. TaxID=1965321 RepID=UPI003D6CA295
MVDVAGNTSTTAVLEGTPEVGSFSGQLEKPGDTDWVKLSLTAGVTYRFYFSFLDTGSVTEGDAVLGLRDANGALFLADDNSGAGTANAFIAFTPATSGTYFAELREFGNDNTGDYSLFVTTGPAINTLLNDGDNIFTGNTVGTTIAGGKGADTIDIGVSLNALGEQGNDIIEGNLLDNIISGGLGDDTLSSGGGTEVFLFGDSGNDVLRGGNGIDHLYGGPGNDLIKGGASGDLIYGGAGADYLDGQSGNDVFFIAGSQGLGDTFVGGNQTDTLQVTGGAAATLTGFNAGAFSIEQWAGNGKGLFGTSAGNVFNFSGLDSKTGLPFVDGGGGKDSIIGSEFADDLRGGSGKDTLKGGDGNDVLTGGTHRDVLYGGMGNDDFDFNSIKESKTGGQRDKIMDFKRGQDDIDLRGIDAKTGVSGNNKFEFIGKDDFSETKGELRYQDLGSKVIVQGDVNGDGKADFEIMVKVGALSAGDFIL